MRVEMGKIYKTASGFPVTVLTVSRKADKPVVALVHEVTDEVTAYYADGRFYATTPSGYDLLEVGPWADFKDGEPVMVRDCVESWHRGHFAGTDSIGRPLTYAEGTKWSSQGRTIYWGQCRRPTPEELAF